MADESLLTMSQFTESQITPAMRLYGVYDPAGTPQDGFISAGGLIEGFYKITPSAAANVLTVALKHMDGTDPSVTNPLVFRIGDSWQTITAALSFQAVNGTNWCNAGSTELATRDIDYFVYLIQETGASAGTKLGYSRIPHAVTMADFVNTSTDEKYIKGNWVNYTSTDVVKNIGRFRATMGASAGFNWTIPTAKVINYPIFETDWLVWSSQSAGFASDPVSATTLYKVRREAIKINYFITTPATSDATTYTATLPFKGKASYTQVFPMPYTYDNGAYVTAGILRINTASATADLFKSAFGTWTASSTKAAGFSAEYYY